MEISKQQNASKRSGFVQSMAKKEEKQSKEVCCGGDGSNPHSKRPKIILHQTHPTPHARSPHLYHRRVKGFNYQKRRDVSRMNATSSTSAELSEENTHIGCYELKVLQLCIYQ